MTYLDCRKQSIMKRTIFLILEMTTTISVPRPIEQNYPTSGGMIILIKKVIEKGVTVIKNECSEIQWMKLSKDFFGFERDLNICYVYFSPSNSSYIVRQNLDVFSISQRDITRYSVNGDLVICGDVNARTGTEIETFEPDNYIPAPFDHVDHTLPIRKSRDIVCNERGRELLDLCTTSNLHCLNGRTLGDLSGKFTCFQYNGNSVVDYCLISNTFTRNILYFHVHIPLLSDHAKLSCQIFADFKETNCIVKDDCIELPLSYLWNSESPTLFKYALNDIEIQKKIANFMSIDFNSDILNTKGIDTALSQFNQIIYSACNRSLKKKIIKKSAIYRKPKNKKWYDSDLHRMKQDLIKKGQLYSKHPCDPIIRGSFFKLRKLYSRCSKQKYRKFKTDIMNKLDNLHENDPNSYWKLVKDLKEDHDERDPSLKISSGNWIKHFSTLFTIDKKFSNQNEYFKDLYENEEKSKTFSELDFRLTEKEIVSATKCLKNNKSAGLDGIKNEMLKKGIQCLLPCMMKLFNLILSNGDYPKQWKVGYLKPIYKCDDPQNPSNYRGIAIMPCLSKVFNGIMNTRLQTYIDKYNVINKVQIGFQPKARTSDHMFVLRTLIQKYSASKINYTLALLISLRHSTLFFTLLYYIDYVKSIYEDPFRVSSKVCIHRMKYQYD